MRYRAVVNSLSEPNSCIELLHLVKSVIIRVSESVMPENDFSRLISITGHLILCFGVRCVFEDSEGHVCE